MNSFEGGQSILECKSMHSLLVCAGFAQLRHVEHVVFVFVEVEQVYALPRRIHRFISTSKRGSSFLATCSDRQNDTLSTIANLSARTLPPVSHTLLKEGSTSTELKKF